MPTDDANVLALAQAIGKIGQDIENQDCPLSNSARQDLIRYAERLAIAAREPEENLYFQATQTAQNAAIRTVSEMGVFEKIPIHGNGIDASHLADEVGVDERLLIRMMRACTSTHLFREVSPYHYVHNAFSAILLTPSNRDMFKQMYDFTGRGVYSLPNFLATKGYKNPTDYDDSSFQYSHNTKLGLWEYLREEPERARVFNSGMRSLATVGGALGNAGPYPFGEELGNEGVGEEGVVVVDVGGGSGHVLEAIKVAFPELKGRMVLQDVQDVIDEATAGRLPDFIEPMAASFFERQPVEGAFVYHFRRIFHDWSDDVSLAILRNTVQAMAPHSRILIIDTVVPEIDAPRHIALQDINMMSFGGMERTRLQWKDLLRRAGLTIIRFWAGDGNLHSAIEARLQI